MTVVTNTIVYRTDTKVEYIFDSSLNYWVSAHQYSDNASALALSATTDPFAVHAVVPGAAFYLDRLEMAYRVNGGTALDGSNKWSVVLQTISSTPTTTTVGTMPIASGALDTWLFSNTTPSPRLVSAAIYALTWKATKTGTPGTLDLGVRFHWRKVLVT